MMSTEDHKKDFTRQGSWMVITTFLSGVCMFAVHVFGLYFTQNEYAEFQALIQMINLMAIPGIGLQTVFAQQTAAAISVEKKAALAGTVQTVAKWTFFLWLAMALTIFIFQKNVLSGLKISAPVQLWITVALGLTQLWGPILNGVMQGQQNFLWLGWVGIFNGLGRFVLVGIIVILLAGRVTGAIIGVAMAIATVFLIALIQTRAVWLRPKPAYVFNWKPWLEKVIPLTLGLGASQFIFSVDFLFVRAVLGEDQTGFYGAAGMIGRGLVMFTAPLTIVMFPKIVHNLSHGKKTGVLAYTTISTAALCGLAAAGCTVVAFILRGVAVSPDLAKGYLTPNLFEKLRTHTEALSVIGQLIPWFVWCMLPLALANVLLNNLMARKQFRVVPYLLLVVASYFTTLTLAGTSFVRVIQILGIYNLVFLAVVAAFTWGGKAEAIVAAAETPDLQAGKSLS
ncbi:MAG: hypothetical protein ABIP76_01725 [Verrucomicrobiota bacterium]